MNKIQGYVTDPHDRASLEFFLTADRDELRAWNAIATEHDIVYAQSLMRAYALELELVARENLIELALDGMNNQYPEAEIICRSFRLMS